MTSLSQQDVAQVGGPLSLLTRQKRDHERLDRLLQRLDRTAPRAEQQEVLQRIARLVFPRAFAEESVIWPLARGVPPGGDGLTRQVEHEHQEVNELRTRLEDLGPSSGERRDVLRRLVEVLRKDVRDEEDVLLPRLQQVVDVRRIRVLGQAWEAVRRTASTRPQPPRVASPSRQRAGGAAADGAGPQPGRARLRGPSVWGVLHGPASWSSERLARAAGRVERLGVLQVGEGLS